MLQTGVSSDGTTLKSRALAWIEAEAGCPDAAAGRLEEARAELLGDAKLALWWDATAAWVLAVVVEIMFRHVLTRPALHRNGLHLTGLDMSWPSGHALRCALVAAALAAAWPRLRVPLAIWLAAVVVLLELAGFHTPTDVAGGLLLATAAAAGAVAVERSGLLRRRAGLGRANAGA